MIVVSWALGSLTGAAPTGLYNAVSRAWKCIFGAIGAGKKFPGDSLLIKLLWGLLWIVVVIS